jgi:VWFA-related protein
MFPHRIIITVGFLIVLGWLGMTPVTTPGAAGREKKQTPEPANQGVIKAEANMVLVSAIVTDKKGNYLRDMKRKDFHVFEDGKEQPITSFSYEAGKRAVASGRQGTRQESGAETNNNPVAPVHRRFIVIFFDNTSLELPQQLYERDQAVRFVESTASPYRLIAVVDYGGTLKLAQDFTANKELLKHAIEMAKYSPVAAGVGGNRGAGAAELNFRNKMRALRAVGRFLGTLPGRQTIIYIGGSVGVMPETQDVFQDTINALNKANVGVYPISALGLQGQRITNAEFGGVGPNFGHGLRGGVPPIYPSGFLQLAQQTGGFAFASNNDIQGAMERVSEELDLTYILGYVQPNPLHNGAYHKIRVKVDRPGTEVRARESYIDTKSPDLLATMAEGQVLEAHAASAEAGEIPITLSKPYFYVKPGMARVNLTVSIPGSDIEFKKHNDKFQSHINVLGIATRDDGSVGARFSDTVNLDYEKEEKQAAPKTSYYYQNSFPIPSGEYTFKLVLTAGGAKFGKYVVPLVVDPFSGKEVALSGPAFGDDLIPYLLDSTEADPALTEAIAPMAANDVQIVPSSSNRFQKDKQPVVYMEVYDPLLASGSLPMGFLYDIVDRKTNQKVHTSNTIPINQYLRPGNPRVPVIFNLLIDKLPAGDYRIEIRARDSAGNVSPVRTGDFSVE